MIGVTDPQYLLKRVDVDAEVVLRRAGAAAGGTRAERSGENVRRKTSSLTRDTG